MEESDFLNILLENRSSPDALARSILKAISDIPENELDKLGPLFEKAFTLKLLLRPNGKDLIVALQRLGRSYQEMTEFETVVKHKVEVETPAESPQVNSLRTKIRQLENKLKERIATNATLKRLINQAKKEISKFESY